jgi:hypothetical protein
MDAIKFSRVISHANIGQKANVSDTSSVSIIRVDADIYPSTMMMERELVSETLAFCPTLAGLNALENFKCTYTSQNSN